MPLLGQLAIGALDLVVHIDLFENETSAFADYLLPVATGIERGGISRANDDHRIVWNDKMIDPPGEAKAGGWIWIELGKRLGFDDVLKVTVFLRNMEHRVLINPVRQEVFGESRPASTLVEIAKLVDPEMLVEIEAIAGVPF